MKGFDFSDIERVNRIELKPGEMVVFRSSHPLTAEAHDRLEEYFEGTPFEGRTVFLTGDWEIDTVLPEGES